MAADMERLLGEVLGKTLEEAAFVFADLPDEAPPVGRTMVEARLAYGGPGAGELVLATTPALASTLAANLLGEDEGGATATGDDEDAVGELLNMMAGTFVAELFGPGAGVHIGLPRVRRVDGGAYARSLAGATAAVTLVEEEGRRIDLAAHAGSGP